MATGASETTEGDRPLALAPGERHEMVAVAAYYLAERRGFSPGGELQDWCKAEALIERMLAQCAVERGRACTRTEIRNALRIWLTKDG